MRVESECLPRRYNSYACGLAVARRKGGPLSPLSRARRGPATVQWRAMHVLRVRDGKVAEHVTYCSGHWDADAIASVSRWNELAEKEGFLVLYPNQQWGRNPYNCWNWFLRRNRF